MRIMKYVTLKELQELVQYDSNYTFTYAPDTEDKEYFKDAWKDIVGNLIHYNGGDAEECLECCINHFDCNGEYIETYRIKPTTEEMSEFLEDCQNWDIASLG